jgi:hypothetical protein
LRRTCNIAETQQDKGEPKEFWTFYMSKFLMK